MIYCLLRTGLPLSSIVLDELLRISLRMYQKERNEQKIVHDDVEGVVTTKWELVDFVGMSGYVFDASIDTSKGSSKVRYIVRSNELTEKVIEEGQWYTLKEAKKKKKYMPDPSNN